MSRSTCPGQESLKGFFQVDFDDSFEFTQVLQLQKVADVIFVGAKVESGQVLPLPSQSAFVAAQKAPSDTDLPLRWAWIQGAGSPSRRDLMRPPFYKSPKVA
jgi:hypothetical protein